MWSDLAAVLIMLAKKEEEPWRLIPALAAADKAVVLGSALPEPRFNRALALEKLVLLSQAHHAWLDYLEFDSTSGWATEAVERLANLERPNPGVVVATRLAGPESPTDTQLEAVISTYALEARNFVEETLFDSWGEAVLNGHELKSARLRELASRIASAEAGTHGDAMNQHAVAAIEKARSAKAKDHISALARGHRAFSEGRRHYERFDFAAAGEHFENAEDELRRGGSSFSQWAEYYLAACAYHAGDFERARQEFETTLATVADQSYPNLLGRLHWSLGILERIPSRLSQAIEHFRAAEALFRRTGEDENVAAIEALISEDLDYLGKPYEAWVFRHRALVVLGRIGGRMAFSLWDAAATGATILGEPEVALHFHEELLQAARTRGDLTMMVFALLGKSRDLHAQGLHHASLATLEEVKAVLEQINDPGIRQRVQADLAVGEGLALAAVEPARALAPLAEALVHCGEARHFVDPVHLYLARARVHETLGDDVLAEKDLSAAVKESELQRGRLLEEPLRLSYLDQRQEPFRRMVRFQLEQRKAPDRALDFAERGRARALHDQLSRLASEGQRRSTAARISGTEPPTTAEIQAALPFDMVLVEFTLLADRLLAWAVQRDSLELISIPISVAELRARVERFQLDIEHSNEELSFRDSGAELYDLLIRPLAPYLSTGAALVVVPDQFLGAIPFAALVERQSGRFLIEERALALAPSAATFLAALARNRHLGASFPSTALIIADPAFDPERYPRLKRLSAAEANSERLASLYAAPQILAAVPAQGVHRNSTA